MKNKVLYLFMFLLLIGGLLAGGSLVKAKEQVEVGVRTGKIAPDFKLTNLQGKEIKLSSFRGQYVILNFWATWCPPCRQEMPYLNKVHLKNKQFTVVAVNIKENKATVRKFIESNNYQFPVLLDQSAKIARRYLIRAIPTTYFLNPQGKIKYIHRGALVKSQLKRIKNKLTKRKQQKTKN